MRQSQRALALAGAIGAVITPGLAHAGKSVQVGNCLAKLPQYQTISAAIAGSPAGFTINVCPGTYAEQLLIPKSLTIQAVNSASANSSLVLITLPTNFTPNAQDLDDNSPIVAGAVVTTNSTVNLIGLTFDASAANGSFSDCSTDLVGVLFQNASGSVQNGAVLNDTLGGSLTGCQQGFGIYAQSSGKATLVSLSGVYVEGFQKGGVLANDAGVVLGASGNVVLGAGPRADIAENAVQIGFGAKGSLIGNLLGYNNYSGGAYAATAALFYDDAQSSAVSNTVQGSQYGVAIANDASSGLPTQSVQDNLIIDAYDAIDLAGAIPNASVSGDTVFGASNSAVHLESPQGGAGAVTATVAGLTVNSACAGIIEGTGDTLKGGSQNTFYNVAVALLTGTDTCAGGDFTRAPRRALSVRR